MIYNEILPDRQMVHEYRGGGRWISGGIEHIDEEWISRPARGDRPCPNLPHTLDGGGLPTCRACLHGYIPGDVVELPCRMGYASTIPGVDREHATINGAVCDTCRGRGTVQVRLTKDPRPNYDDTPYFTNLVGWRHVGVVVTDG